MSTPVFDTNLGTFKEFSSYVKKYGFSISNFYDVNFELTNSSNLSPLNTVLKRTTSSNPNSASPVNISGMLRYYAEECSIPGFQISTGEYRVTNTPQLKYAYGIVNNEITFSFIGDANAEIRKTFDAWQSFIYAHNIATQRNSADGILNINVEKNLGRVRYRNEYTSDILIVKYERAGSCDVTTKTVSPTKLTNSYFRSTDIVPDFKPSSDSEILSKFKRALPLYSIRLMNAFPTNISSIPLSSGSSELVKVQVTFEYETAVSSAHNNGSVTGNIKTFV